MGLNGESLHLEKTQLEPWQQQWEGAMLLHWEKAERKFLEFFRGSGGLPSTYWVPRVRGELLLRASVLSCKGWGLGC